MKKLTWILYLALAITGILSLENIVNAQPVFGPNSAILSNAYLPLKVGDKLSYKSYGFPIIDYYYIEVITKEIVDQVECLKIKYSESSSYVEYYWFAEDTSGNIWMLQYHDVELNDLIFYGRNNAKLIMPSQVNVGSTIFDGAETVVATGITVPKLSTGLGPYYNCIKSKIDYGDGDIDYVYYAPGIGQVKEEWNDDGGINGYEISAIGVALWPGTLCGGWCETWMDWINDVYFPWGYHDKYGWIYIFGKDPDNLWFYNSRNNDYWWTTADLYPNVYFNNEAGWFYNEPGTNWFYSYNTGQWVQK